MLSNKEKELFAKLIEIKNEGTLVQEIKSNRDKFTLEWLTTIEQKVAEINGEGDFYDKLVKLHSLILQELIKIKFDEFSILTYAELDTFYKDNSKLLMQNLMGSMLQKKRKASINKIQNEDLIKKEIYLVHVTCETLCFYVEGKMVGALFNQAGEIFLNDEAPLYLDELARRYKDYFELIQFYKELILIYKQDGLDKVWVKLEYRILNDLAILINSPEAAQNLMYKKQLLEEAISLTRVPALNIASNQGILGTIYIKLPEGDHAQNIENAIYYLQEALKFYVKEKYLLDWARLTNHLGRAFYERPSGDPVDNLNQSLGYLEESAKILSTANDQGSWASNQFNLGLTCMMLGEEYSEKSINCFTNSLKNYELTNRVTESAFICMYLGGLFYNRKQGQSETNLEDSIRFYEKSLVGITKTSYPGTWANLQLELGVAYSFRSMANLQENKANAIECFENAIAFFKQDTNTKEQLEQAYYDTGNSYLHFKDADVAQNIEKAIDYFILALKLTNRDAPQSNIIFTGVADAVMYEKLKRGLGEAFLTRLIGDRAHNIEKALKYFDDAFFPHIFNDLPQANAELCNLMGIAYFERVLDSREDNLEESIAYYQKAIAKEPENTYFWYMIHMNLGNAYRERIAGNPDENNNEAISHLKMAVEHISEEKNADAWCKCQNSLGNLYLKISDGDPTRLLTAIQHFKNAIEGRKNAQHYFELGQNYKGLGVALFSLQQSNKVKEYEPAITALNSAAEILNPDVDPKNAFDIFYILGNIFFEEKKWKSCVEAFSEGHRSIENLRSQILSEYRRKDLAEKSSVLYKKLVGVCILMKEYETAFQFASAAKSRSLLDHLDNPIQTLETLLKNNEELAEFWKPVEKLRLEIDRLVLTLQRKDLYSSGNSDKAARSKIIQEVKEKRIALQQRLDSAFFSFPQLSSTNASASIKIKEAKELSRQLNNIALIEYFETDSEWGAFVVTGDILDYVSLAPSSNETIKETINWLNAYEKGLKWALEENTVKSILSSFFLVLFRPISVLLPPRGSIMIAPFQQLHLLPFEIAINDENGNYLSDDYTITYVPSLSILYSLYRQHQTGKQKTKNLLTIVYSSPGSKFPIPYVIEEAKLVKQFFNESTSIYLEEDDALPDAVINACNENIFDVIHIACHGNFDSYDPNNSGLLLNNGSILTVERIQTELRLKNKPLVILSACDTGLILPQRADENQGLVQSFLAAGAGGVVSSLWSVNDAATQALFIEFYKSKSINSNYPEALTAAMLSVKNNSQWKKPFFWGAFRYTGFPLKT
ncbi:MAG: CHAT domain-containing protein [Ferruginibacter sp.]